MGLVAVAGCGGSDPGVDPLTCEVTGHAPQPVDQRAQYLDFVLARTAPPEAEGQAVRMITWDENGAVLGADETTIEDGAYRFELDEGYARFSYQIYVTVIDVDGDAACGAGDPLYRGITNAWNPVDNAAYEDEGPGFGSPVTSGEGCAAVAACTIPAR